MVGCILCHQTMPPIVLDNHFRVSPVSTPYGGTIAGLTLGRRRSKTRSFRYGAAARGRSSSNDMDIHEAKTFRDYRLCGSCDILFRKLALEGPSGFDECGHVVEVRFNCIKKRPPR
jgi:hypothetical protein